MKKLFLMLMLVLLCNVAYGAESDDIYLRKDVFEAKMNEFMAEIRLGNELIRREIDERFNQLDKKIDERFNTLDKKIDNVHNELDKKIDNVQATLDKKIDSVHNELDKKIDNVQATLDKKIDNVHSELGREIALLAERTEGTRNTVYLGLAFLGIIIVFAPDFLKRVKELRKPSLTLEDVKKLIEENNVKIFEMNNTRFAAK